VQSFGFCIGQIPSYHLLLLPLCFIVEALKDAHLRVLLLELGDPVVKNFYPFVFEIVDITMTVLRLV
jgi:hypothetical protein